MPINVICKKCNKEYKIHPYRLNTSKYCSIECSKSILFKKGHKSITNFKKGYKSTLGMKTSLITKLKQREKKLKNGHVNQYGYKINQFLSKLYLEHHKVWIQKSDWGFIPQGYVIHHRNGNKLDNRIENLLCINKRTHALITWQQRRQRKQNVCAL